MANASVVCTDKTGTLTQNSMTVVAGSIGIRAKFVRNLKDNEARTNASDKAPELDEDIQDPNTITEEHRQCLARKHADDFTLDQGELNSTLSPKLKALFNEAIAINSTAFEDTDPDTGMLRFVGSKTEMALLMFAKDLGWDDYRKIRDNADVVQMLPFSSERKAMGVVVRIQPQKFRLYLKGASEILSKKCTKHVVVTPGPNQDSEEDVQTMVIDETAMDNISRTIIFYANQTLRTIALCYRDFESWPPPGTSFESVDEVSDIIIF
jgi:Ca2+-transporting ATPase